MTVTWKTKSSTYECLSEWFFDLLCKVRRSHSAEHIRVYCWLLNVGLWTLTLFHSTWVFAHIHSHSHHVLWAPCVSGALEPTVDAPVPRICLYRCPQHGYWYARCFTEIKQASKSAVCEIQHKRAGELIRHRIAKDILQSITEFLQFPSALLKTEINLML